MTLCLADINVVETSALVSQAVNWTLTSISSEPSLWPWPGRPWATATTWPWSDLHPGALDFRVGKTSACPSPSPRSVCVSRTECLVWDENKTFIALMLGRALLSWAVIGCLLCTSLMLSEDAFRKMSLRLVFLQREVKMGSTHALLQKSPLRPLWSSGIMSSRDHTCWLFWLLWTQTLVSAPRTLFSPIKWNSAPHFCWFV